MTMQAVGANTARIHAISLPAMEVSGMDREQFDREMKYQVSLSIVQSMLEKGLISTDDFSRWQQRLIERYDPPIGRIVSNRVG